MTAYQPIRPADFPWFRYEGYTFSLGLVRKRSDGRTEAVLSGHSASEYDAEAGRIVVRGGMAEQAGTAYAKVSALLAEAGLGAADVTRIVENVTVPGLAHAREINRARTRLLASGAAQFVVPVSTVVVDALLRRDALVEVEVRAVTGGGESLGRVEAGFFRPDSLRATPDGEVYLPTAQPLDPRTQRVLAATPGEQYRRCLEVADGWLRAVGLDLTSVVSVREMLVADVPAAFAADRDAVRRELLGAGGVFPAFSTVRVGALHEPGLFVALDIVASRRPLRAVRPQGWDGEWSPGVRAGDVVHLSGFDGRDPVTGEIAPDVVAQAETAYCSVFAVLAAEGLGPEALTETIETVTPTGLPGYRGVAGVRERMLRAGRADPVPWPASTGLICHGLSRPDAHFQVLATAVAA
ncbi:MAG: hypothetical protein HOV68_15105 [Streptomycetaceae bacterium]|nr:hypothetical protein [Streptomycetaceae bacterium]